MTRTATLQSTYGYTFQTVITAKDEAEMIEVLAQMFPVCPVLSLT